MEVTPLFTVFVCFIAGIGAGLGTGFAGLSAAAVISPILITFLRMDPYLAVGVALASDVLASAVIGSICGFVGAGGGMMMLLILTSVLGYELKTAVGTSVFIMSFTAFTGAVSHFAIGGRPDLPALVVCVLSTLLWARVAAHIANRAEAKTLSRVVGVLLVVLGLVVFGVEYLI